MQRRRKVIAVKHNYYEELCIRTVLGHASKKQFRELLEHLKNCSGCREMAFQYRAIVSALRGLGARKRHEAFEQLVPGCRELFSSHKLKIDRHECTGAP